MSDSPLTARDSALAHGGELTFNLLAVLPGRASSEHTQRAYYRWIDGYLAQVAGLEPTAGTDRLLRMSALPVETLRMALTAPQLRAWLGRLAADENGKQGLNQARAAVTTLASLLAEASWLPDEVSAAMHNVRLPGAEDGQRPGRWLSLDQINALMVAARRIGTTENQIARNDVLTTMLCTMALRREEVSNAQWGDLSVQNDRMVLRVHGKGHKIGLIDVPLPVLEALTRWRRAVAISKYGPDKSTPLLRRLWKGGGISKAALSADGVWLVINESAAAAEIGHVAPHDLRRSVAGALHESGVPIEKISRLLRHSNVAITERYLSRLPQRNEGAVLMSDMLGLEDD